MPVPETVGPWSRRLEKVKICFKRRQGDGISPQAPQAGFLLTGTEITGSMKMRPVGT